MAFSRLVTELRASRTQLKEDLKAAEADLRAFHTVAAQLGTVNIGGPGGTRAGGFAPGTRLPTTLSGGRTVSQQIREEVRDKLADHAQTLRFRKDLSNQEDKASRERRAANKREFDENKRRREQELSDLKRSIQERAREETRVRRTIFREQSRLAEQQGFATGIGARGRAQQRRAEERAAAETAQVLGLGTRGEEARRAERLKERQERERVRQLRSASFLAAAAGQASRIDRPGGGFFGGGPGGPPRGPGGIDEITNKVRGGLTNAFQRASNAAQQLNLLVGVSIFGGIGALVAEGFRLNSQLEKVNLTMAATLGITNQVVDSQGELVLGQERTQFLLKGTAGIYDQVRKIAAETILEQQELLETVAENLALGQQAGFKLETLSAEETGPLVETIANISQLAKAVGLPGGQRQLSQEVRALFTGERLQGATIARLLGFTSIEQIQELQQQPGKEPGTTRFAEELEERFKRVKPILDEFQNSAQGVFSTLISQGRLFLQVFSEAAFDEIVVAGRKLRDFLTDERIKATAQELGRSFGNLARTLIDVGRSLAPLANLFGFMVRHAPTIITVLGAFRALRFLQNLRGIGGGGLVAFLGGGGRLGSALGGAAGAGGRAVGPIRGAAIEFASAAAGAGGIRAALARQGGLARGALGATLGRGGLGLLAPAAGLAGLTPAVATILLPLIAGLGIGTGGNALINRGITAGIRPPPAQVNADRALTVRQIQSSRARRGAALARARDLERGGRAARIGDDTAGGELPLVGLAERALALPQGGIERLLFGIRPAPDLTEKVTARGLRQRAAQIEKEIDADKKKAAELRKLQLQRIEDANQTERLQAAQFLAQIRRNKEAEINLTAQLDAINARNQIQDHQARNMKLLAIEEDRVKKLRELREDERSEIAISAFQALGDEERAAFERAVRARTEIEREFQGRELTPELLQLRNQKVATANLNAQREVLGARVGRLSQRAGFAGQLAGVEGRPFAEIQAQGFNAIASVAQQVVEQKVTVQEFNRFVVAQNKLTQRLITDAQEEAKNKGIALTDRFTDAVRRSTDLQREYELSLIRFKERVRDRDFARTKERLQQEVSLRRATQAKIDAIVDKSLFDRTRGAQRAAFGVLTAPTEFGGRVRGADTFFGARGASVEEQLRERFLNQAGQNRATRDLPFSQRFEAASQQAREFMRELVDTLTGPGGVTAALEQLRGQGITLSRGEEKRLAAAGLEGGRVREDRTVFGEIREVRGVRESVQDARQAEQDARDQQIQSAREDRRTLRDERLERQQANREFNQEKVQLARDFASIAKDTIKFGKEMDRAGIVIDKELIPALRRAVSVIVPSPEKLAGQEAAAAVAENKKLTPGARPRLPVSKRPGQRIIPSAQARGSFEEFVAPEAQTTFGQPGSAISDLGRLTFGAVPGGNAAAEVNEALKRDFSSIREQTVSEIPGINLNGMMVSPETAALVARSARRTVAEEQEAARTMIVEPPNSRYRGFPGAPRDGSMTESDQRASAGTTINIDLGGLKIGADTKETIEKLGTQLQRDARRTPVS